MGVPEPMLSVAAYYDSVAARIIAEAGQDCLFTQIPSIADPYANRKTHLAEGGGLSTREHGGLACREIVQD
jgi:hypothetical protein